MSRKTAEKLLLDRTRITPVITSSLYVRLVQRVGVKSGAMSEFCERAIEHELSRGDSRLICGND